MIGFIPRPPSPGSPPGPGYFDLLDRCLRSMQIIAGRGVRTEHGPNGTVVHAVGGGLPRSVPMPDHPFQFADVSSAEVPFTFTISPGQFIARGASGPNYMFPEVATAGSGVYLSDIPAPTFTVAAGKDAYVVLKAIYTVTAGVAVWSASIIKTHEVSADAPVTGLDNDYLNGHLSICRVARAPTGTGLVLKETWIRSNIMHIKSNTLHHFWTVQ